PITGSGVAAATIPGRWAAPPAPAMITRRPRPAAVSAYRSIPAGVRCADTTCASQATPNSRSTCTASDITGQSEALPMITPTLTPAPRPRPPARDPPPPGTARRPAAPYRAAPATEPPPPAHPPPGTARRPAAPYRAAPTTQPPPPARPPPGTARGWVAAHCAAPPARPPPDPGEPSPAVTA